ncbi:MAG: autotransporter domain-containing protein, partial [Acidaminococcaceae bacterium]|nr:autotransporter domain-containing protein [Acidaminococcaceae bacterium]
MSKKMLKRSLALGALMAFVITGQAWASTKVKYYDGTVSEYSSTLTLTQNTNLKAVRGDGEGYDIQGKAYELEILTGAADPFYYNAAIYYCGNIDVSKLTIESDKGGINMLGGDVKITANDIYVTADSSSAIWTPDDTGSENKIMRITFVNEMGIVANGNTNGIQAGAKGSKFYINGTKGFESNLTITASENAVYARKDGTQIIISDVNDVSITSTNSGEKGDYKGYAIISGGNNGTGVGSNIQITATGDVDITSARTAVYANKGNIGVVGKTIDIIAGEGAGVRAGTSTNDAVRGNGHVVLGDANTQSITIEGEMDYGIIARAKNSNGTHDVQSSVVVNGQSLVIGEKEGSNVYAGLCAASGTAKETGYESTTIDVNTVYTTINADIGIYNMSNGTVSLDGNVTINAKEDAIYTRGFAKTDINVSNDNQYKTVINGDVCFGYDEDTSGSTVNAYVNMNLAGSDSVWNGNTKVEWALGDSVGSGDDKYYKTQFDSFEDLEAKLEVKNVNLTLADGAVWNPNAVNEENKDFTVNNKADIGKSVISGTMYTALNNLVLDGGIVNIVASNMKDASGNTQTLKIDEASGTGIFAVDSVTANQVEIGNSSVATLTVQGSSELADKVASGEVSLQAIADTVVTTSGVATQTAASTVTTEEGLVGGAYSAQVDEAGKVVTETITQQVNTKSDAVSDAGMALKAHWRAHMNDMNKRMGDLRMANGETGVWTRMVRGESEYQGAEMQYNQYQLGYDEKLSVDKRWTVGAAVTFSEGDASYGYGSTDDKSTAFAIYGSKLNNDGTFVDLIARYAHLESDLDDNNYGTGDYSTNGMSVSAEFGKRIEQGNGLWIEP